MNGPKVVIIGAGVVGAALADELSLRGWDDITVVDQGALPKPGGSSSHAPGMVFQVNASKALSQMAQYTVKKFSGLEFDGQTAFATVGGLEIATTPERLQELHRRYGWARSWGLNPRLVSPAECVGLFPLLDEERVLGGLYDETDGAARAVVAVNAQLAAAAARGVRILERHEVLDVRVEDGAVTGLETDKGFVDAEIVVLCAGIWGPKIASMVGMTLPMTAMEHQFAWTEPLPSLSDHTEDATLPMLRHMDEGLYYRDRFDRLEVGSFAHRPITVAMDEILGVDEAPVMPSVHPFTPDDFVPQWRDTQRLMPETLSTTVDDGMNGIMAFTPDDFPLLGPSPDISGFWVAEGVWVTHSAGVGLAMAEWLVDGQSTTFSLHECEISRFDQHQLSPSYIEKVDVTHYLEVYDIKHPLEPSLELRPLRTSPFYTRQQALGAVFLDAGGWERPQWYETNAALVPDRELPRPEGWTTRHWSPIVGAEAQYTREHVAMYDMTPLRHLVVQGVDAESFLQELTSADVSRPIGDVTYCVLLADNGTIRSDVTVTRVKQNEFHLGVNSAVDIAWLHERIDGRQVLVQDVTSGWACIGLWGPEARHVIEAIDSDIDFSANSFRYFKAKQGYLASVPIMALRVSYVGELGWELYTTADMAPRLWDTLWNAGQQSGIIAAGRGALSSLRLEKGYRAFGADMTFEHDPFEAGLGFAVKKTEHTRAHDALTARKSKVQRRLTCLTHDDTSQFVLSACPVRHGADIVGYVTSAAYGYTIGRGIAYAWLPAELARPGQALTIENFGASISAVVTEEPLFDPSMERVRA